MRKSILNKELISKVELLESENIDNKKYIKNLQGKIDKLGKLNKENEIKSYDSKLQNLSNDLKEIKNELAQSNEKYDSLGITFLIMLIIFDNKVVLFFNW